MIEQPEPERFEIELSSNLDDGRGWRHRDTRARSKPESSAVDEPADDDVVVSEPIADHRGAERDDQRRLFVIATIVGALALVLGWLIGRAGGSDELATTADATAPVTTEAERSDVLTGETLPSAIPPTTRPPRTTTTSTLVPAIIEIVDVDPRLADVDLRLVGVEGRNVLVELDLATQLMVRRELGGIMIEPQTMLVGDDWFLLPDPNQSDSWVVTNDGSRRRVDLGEPWGLLWQTGTDRFWRSVHDLSGGPTIGEPTVYEEVDLAGDPTGAELELPFDSWPWRTDPAGGLIVDRAGKLYSVDESSVALIATGEAIAVSADQAVMRECDDQLRCGLFVTDRSTGDVTQVPLDAAIGDRVWIQSIHGWGAPAVHPIAPDGSMCAVILLGQAGLPIVALLDLRSGGVVELGVGSIAPTVVWSPDARFAFFIDGYGSGSGGVSAYDRQTGEVFSILSETLNWSGLAARPA